MTILRNRLLIACVIWIGLASSSPGIDGEKLLNSATAKANQGNTGEALEEILNYIEELRASDLDPAHPAIAYALACAGFVANSAGEHEEAVRYLQEGLPILNETARPGFLLLDEFGFNLALVSSLNELDRTDESLAVLEKILDQTRRQLEWTNTGIISGKKGYTDDGQEMRLSSLYPNENWVKATLELIGEIRTNREEWPEAETAFKEAGEILERLHPESQLDLAKLREKWEIAARKQGKPIRPKVVGRFSSPQSIEFEGVESIPEEEIRSAMLRSSTCVLASHPAGDFEEYLKVLPRCLELGYRKSGFPDVTVEADWNEEMDTILVRVEEGTRYEAGQIQFEGVDSELRQKITDSIVVSKEGEAPETTRSEIVFSELHKEKKLPAERVRIALMETFPEYAAFQDSTEEAEKPASSDPDETFPMEDFFPKETGNSSENRPFWKVGKAIEYRPATLGRVRRSVQAAYAEEGKSFPKFEVDWEPQPASGIVDVRITVQSEGPTHELGEIHVKGNRVNTKKEILEYLELETGNPATGDLKNTIERSLFNSGRFLAWEVTPFRRDPKSNRLDLLIMVEEHWEAPPLSAPLSRTQQALLKFAKWFNEEAGESEDLVMEIEGESEDYGFMEASLVYGDGSFAFLAANSELDHVIAGELDGDGASTILVATEEGARFRASFPVTKIPLTGFYKLTQTLPRSAEDFPMGGVQFGAGLGGSKDEGSFTKKDSGGFSIDPTLALSQGGSWANLAIHFEEDSVIIQDGEFRAEIDEATGRLISIRAEAEGFSALVETSPNAMDEFRSWIDEQSQTAPDWGEGKDVYSLFFLASAFLGELSKEIEKDSEAGPDEILGEVGARTLEKWSSLASVSGETLGSILEPDSSSSEKPFEIPYDPRNFETQYASGGNLMLMLNLGLYDYLASYLEPGTWPDLVVREILFLADGKPLYLNQTIETLLEDEKMGPLGCLICSGLLQRIGHNSAPRFVQKARGQLSAEGFAGDWSLLLNGKADEDGVGWSMLKILRELKDDQIDEFLTSSSEEARNAIKEVLSKARSIEDTTEAEDLRPMMDALWEHILQEPIHTLVEQAEERLTPKVDPAVFAASVNGAPVPRGAVRMLEEISRRTGGKSSVGMTPLDESIALLLMAQEMWRSGQSATPQAIETKTSQWIQMFSPGGREKLESMGLNQKMLNWWVGVQLAADAQVARWMQSKEAGEEEARNFYQQNPQLFGASQERHIHLIALQKKGDGAEQKSVLNQVLDEVQATADMKAKLEIFGKTAGKHSRIKPELKGDLDWIKPREEWFPALADEMEKVPDKEISEVFEANGHLFLILAQGSRIGEARPFEEVAMKAKSHALLKREQALLRKRSLITIYDESAVGEPEDPASTEADSDPLSSLAETITKVGENLIGGDSDQEGEDATEAAEEEPDTRSLLERTIDEAEEGDPGVLYLLGAFAERGFGPEPGLKEAVSNYRKAAAAGDRQAMLRLAELYRIGRGVEMSEKTSRRWQEKADALVFSEETKNGAEEE